MTELLPLHSAKRFVLSLWLLLAAVAANAIPAKPGQRSLLTLADGTTVSALLVGDEHSHYWLGDDGQAYLADGDTYRAVALQTLKARGRQRRHHANQHRLARSPRRVGAVGSYTGQKKGLIILVNFTDVTFQTANNNALFKRIANEENFSYGDFKGSMRDYFYAQSEGQFELNFDVVGPVTVSKKQSYYGSNDSEGSDKLPATMVIEALKLADSQVNYADYDWDGDGEVEQVYVVYAGKGEADGGAANTIWPHEWQLSQANQYGDGSGRQKLDGVYIDTYACGAELNGSGKISGIGTMCHEFSHCLGYPDFYDTDYSGGQGMFEWDLMDSGSYNGDGYLPAGYTSYERWVAGWKTPIELTATLQVDHMKALQEGGDSYIIYNDGNRNEYFLLENRQLTGWDAGVPAAGLLILHVDYDAGVWDANEPNDNPSHQRMTWIPADNKYQYTTSSGNKYYTTEGAKNDPFPYGSVNAFGPTTTPAAKLYNKNAAGSYYLSTSVENITRNADGTVSFLYRGISNVKTPAFSPAAGRYAEAQTVSISCETQGAAIYYTTDGTTPTLQSRNYTGPITIAETTTLKAIAVKDDEQSAVATAKFTIGQTASDPSATCFKRVSAAADLEPGLRYIIACGSKGKAAGQMGNSILGAADVTVSGDEITIGSSVAVFVLNETADGWSFQNEADGQFLYATAAKKLAYGSDELSWTLADGTDGVVMTYGSFGTMLYNVSSPRFTTYTSNPSASMIQASLYVENGQGSGNPDGPDGPDDPDDPDGPDGPDDPDQPANEGNCYELVTDASTLAAGDEVIIAYVSGETKLALSTTQNTNNRAATADVTLNADGTLTPGSEVQLITLEKDGSYCLFNVGDGYLYAASSNSNWLRTEENADANAKAGISISDGDATIQFQGGNERNFLRFNQNGGKPIFSCYASSSSVKSLPQIYRKVPPVSVTISAVGYSTLYYAGKHLMVPDGVEASCYYVEDGRLQAAAVGSVIPAGTAVVLADTKADGRQAHTYQFAVANSASAAAPVRNDLYGSDVDAVTSVPAGGSYKYYMLSLNADGNPQSVGFYYGAEDGAAFQSQAHKAFLAVPVQQGQDVRAFLFNGDTLADEASAIGTVSADSVAPGCYDLSGRQLKTGRRMAKGIYIVDGRKVVVK